MLPRGRRSLIIGTATLVAAAVATSTAALRIVDHTLLRPPAGIENPESLFRVRLLQPGREGRVAGRDMFTASETSALANENTGIEVAAFSSDVATIHLSGTTPDTSLRFRIAYVNEEYGRVLGARLLIGNWSNNANHNGVILNYRTWIRFGGAVAAPLGTAVRVGGEWRVLTGVTSESFAGTETGAVDGWIPVAVNQVFANKGYALRVIARSRGLEAKGTPHQLRVRLESALLGEKEFGGPDEDSDARVELRALSKGPWRGTSPKSTTQWSFAVLIGALALMNLVVAGSSAAALWLLRLAREQKVVEIQVALGASLRRVLRRELSPLTLAGITGALAGAMTSSAVQRLIVARVQFEGAGTTSWTSRDTLITLGTVCLAVAVTVVPPAIRAFALAWGITRGARVVGQNRSQGWLRFLVAVQASVAFVIVAMGLLLGKSVREGTSDRIGFAPDGLLWLDFRDDASVVEALGRVRAMPSVKETALSSSLAMSAATMVAVRSPELSRRTAAVGGPYVTVVSPGFFSTIRPPRLRGRDFSVSDAAGSELVAVVGETMARVLWPGVDPIGQCLNAAVTRREGQTFMCHRVVGVVADMPSLALRDAAPMQFYVTMAQRSDLSTPTFMLIREQEKGGAIAAIRTALTPEGSDPSRLRMGRVSDLLEPEIRPLRLGSMLAGVTGAFVMALSAVGLFAVTAYSVEQRRREFAIRFAVGASPSRIWRIVLAESAVILGLATVVGVALLLLSANLLNDLTYKVSVRDPGTLAGSLLVIAVAIAMASLVPASRAGQVDIRRMLSQ